MPSPAKGEGKGMRWGRESMYLMHYFLILSIYCISKEGIAFYGNVKVIALQDIWLEGSISFPNNKEVLYEKTVLGV